MEGLIIDAYRKDEEIIKHLESAGGASINCIYGCGDIGLSVKEYLAEYNIEVNYFLVDDQYYISSSYQGINILKLSDINRISGKVNIIIGFSDINKAMEKLNEYKAVADVFCLSNPFVYLKEYDLDKNYFGIHRKEFEKSYDIMEDSLSKEIYKAFLNTRINLNYEYMLPYGGCRTYFGNELFSLTEEEVYVDCGAYDGDSVRTFLNSVNNKYKKIYAIEPDRFNFKKIENFVQKENILNIELINNGVWKEKDRLGFSETGNQENSVVENEPTNFLEVDSLDNMLKDEDVTFIKMSVQGCEEEALLGTSKVLKDKAPRLAITIFMKPDALVKIPQTIKSINPKYKIYLRCEDAFFARVILYAKVDK